jgi:hypothetical protein
MPDGGARERARVDLSLSLDRSMERAMWRLIRRVVVGEKTKTKMSSSNHSSSSDHKDVSKTTTTTERFERLVDARTRVETEMAREMEQFVMTEASRAYAQASSKRQRRDVVESVVDACARRAARDARKRRRTRADEDAREREAIDDAMRKWREVKGKVVPEMMERAVLEMGDGGRRRSRRRRRRR